MSKSPKVNAYVFFFMGTLFVILAIMSASLRSGWDLMTIILVAFAAFDYFVGFKFLGMEKKSSS